MTAREFGTLIREIAANANQYVGSQAAEYGIKYGQFEYFLLIYIEPGINQLELGRKKGVGKASVTKALKKLEEQGFVTRIVDYEDKRNLRCYVTEKGSAIADELIGLSAHVEADIFAGFSEDEKEQFYSYLHRLLSNTRRMAESVHTVPEE